MAEHEHTRLHAICEIIEWLAGDECHELDDAGLADGLGRRLRAADLPLDHLVLSLRTLDPEIRGRTVAWAPGERAEIRDRAHGTELLTGFADSPVRHVMERQEPLVLRVDDGMGIAWIHTDLFEGRDLVEFIILPLYNANGLPGAASFATARKHGFTDAERAILNRIVPALRNACELRILRRVELGLLDTYVGAETARRVLAGHIRRGRAETLEAALMLCDLRGFTELSNRLPNDRVIQLLNTYFDCVVPAIIHAGGEVIKFMGDAVLAFFHHDEPVRACTTGLQAASSALERLRQLTLPDAELRAGIALHYGEVSYGNIGYGQRLDFTLIGPDVNLVSRLQAVSSTTGHSLVMSERFAQLIGPTRVTALGRHELKGFAEPAELFTLVPTI
jgi:adenylate cyclase